MKIFQRFEVWLLLVLAAGAMVFVFKTSAPDGDNGSVTNTKPADDAAPAEPVVHRLSLERDFGNARLDVDVRLTNRHAKKLQLAPPVMRLIAGKDHQVPEFFLPVEPLPELPPKTTADVHLRYWLEKADLNSTLTLHFEDQSIELKSDKPFDLEKLKNAQPTVLKLGQWE